MSTLGARKLFFVRKRIIIIIIFLISFVNYNIYIYMRAYTGMKVQRVQKVQC